MDKKSEPVLHTCLAAPGLGKTESFLSRLGGMIIEEEKHVLLALPTMKLSDDIKNRCKKMYGDNFKPNVINSESHPNVTRALKTILEFRERRFVICTHEALHRLDAEYLDGWILVFDELPNVLALGDANFKEAERDRIEKYTDENKHGKLSIKSGLKTELQERIATAKKGNNESALGKEELAIFEALLDTVDVYVDKPDKHDKRAYRIIKIHDYSSHIKRASECHLMCANLDDMIFEAFLNIWDIKTETSYLTPQTTTYSNTDRITIYPQLEGRKFTKGLALREYKDGKLGKKLDYHKPKDYQVIDEMLGRTFKTLANRKRLLFTNKYANFTQLKTPEQWIECKYDSRGLNSFEFGCCTFDGLVRT